MEPVPSRKDRLLALCDLTRRHTFAVELRECLAERTRRVASVRHLTANIS